MLSYTLTVYFLLAERLGGVILDGDDSSDKKGLLDLWWSPGCNERSGCKNWMRGVWTAETQFEADRRQSLHGGVSLAEARLHRSGDAPSQEGPTWVHDDSDAPTTAQHGWIASKTEYENHVLLLEHEEDGEQPECHSNGLVKVSDSFLNGRLIQPGSVLLVEQCEQADGGSVEHFGTVTHVHHDGTHAHVSTDPMTHDEVRPLIRGGSASLLLPLADEVVAHDASEAARRFFERNQFLERGSLQRVVKATKELDIEQQDEYAPEKKAKTGKMSSAVGAFEKVPANLADTLADQLDGLTKTEAGKVIAAYKASVESAAKDFQSSLTKAKELFAGKITYTGQFSKSAEAKTQAEGDDGKPSAGVSGEVTGAYKLEARCGASLIAELKWEGQKIVGFTAGVEGTAALSLNANASISAKAYFHAYLLNFVELNMGMFFGPAIKLAIKPIVTLDVIAQAKGTANLTAGWEGTMKLANDATIATDDDKAVGEVDVTAVDEASERTTWKFESSVTGHVNAGIKMSLVFTAGFVAGHEWVASATASVSATMGAEFEGSFNGKKVCAQFQLTSQATATLKASFLFFAWTRKMTLKELSPIKLCGKTHNAPCVWQLDGGAERSCKPAGSMLQAAVDVSASNSGLESDDDYQLDDYYHSL